MCKKAFFHAAVFAFGMSFPAAGQSLDKVKACFVYLGPIADGGWTYQHHLGAESAKVGLGDRVEIAWAENVNEDSSAEAVIDREGPLRPGDVVALNRAYELNLALKRMTEGGGGHSHDHSH